MGSNVERFLMIHFTDEWIERRRYFIIVLMQISQHVPKKALILINGFSEKISQLQIRSLTTNQNECVARIKRVKKNCGIIKRKEYLFPA